MGVWRHLHCGRCGWLPLAAGTPRSPSLPPLNQNRASPHQAFPSHPPVAQTVLPLGPCKPGNVLLPYLQRGVGAIPLLGPMYLRYLGCGVGACG